MNKNITIKEVAEEAGVSIASISRALNSRSGVSDATRQRIVAVCEKLGYVPDRSAIQLATRESNVVGIYFAKRQDIVSRYTCMLLPHLTKSLSQSGLTPMPIVYDGEGQNNFKAVILVGLKNNDIRIKQLKENRTPFVCIGMNNDSYSVCPDDKNGIIEAVSHLISLNKTNIAFVTPNLREAVMVNRFEAYLGEMKNNNLDHDCIFIDEGNSPELQAYRYFINLPVEELMRYDALVCFSDEIAKSTYQALQDRGISVPSDIAIVGFDGIIGLSDNLTTLKQDFKEIAETAVRLVHRACENKKIEQVIVPVTLEISKSTVG